MNSSIGNFSEIFTNFPYNGLHVLADATLQAKYGRAFDVHRMVLASKSDYFRAMFSFNENINKFPLPSIENRILECILIFLYTDQLSLRLEIVPDLLNACDFLLLDKLSTECCSFVMKNLDIPNCLPILDVAWKLNNRLLFQVCFRFAHLYFQDIVDNSAERVASLSIEILKMLLAENSLNVSSEQIVWNIICTWIENDLPLRLQYVPEMLTYLNLEHAEESLTSSIISHSIVSKNEHCKAINELKAGFSPESILKSHMFLRDYPIFRDGQNRLPSCMNSVVNISSSFQSSAIQLFITFDEKFDACQKISDLDFFPHTSIILDNKLNLFGGNNSGLAVFSWDLINNARFSIRQSFFLKFSKILNYEIVVLQNSVMYCVQSDPKHNPDFETLNSNKVQRYIPELDEWSFVASPLPMYVQNVKSCCGKIYAFGYFFTNNEAVDPNNNNLDDPNNNDLNDPNNNDLNDPNNNDLNDPNNSDSDDFSDDDPDDPNNNDLDDFNDNDSDDSNIIDPDDDLNDPNSSDSEDSNDNDPDDPNNNDANDPNNNDLDDYNDNDSDDSNNTDPDDDDLDESITNMLAQVYNPQTDTWTAIALPAKERTNCSVVNYKNKLLLIGGSDNEYSYKEAVDEYDPVTNSWSPKPNLPVRYISPKAVVLNEVLYIYENFKDHYNKQYITPPIFWSETHQTWQTVQDSFPFFNFKRFQFYSIDNADTVKKIIHNRRSSAQKWIQNCFV